ncbi:serine-rich adhesin for platelets-like [Mytilus californianus]|uniref:serine-rich adhesin for platelets-like n=1 Tax=Mytilus californianus TaxID=6549 RepID=UPI00224834DF|nr:serine-rich adhesin for platelets-like [Mytilus californianus]
MVTPEEMAIANKRTEKKIFNFISAIKWASEKNSKNEIEITGSSSISKPVACCSVQGSGLKAGVVGRKTKFTVTISNVFGMFDLYLQLKGPRNEVYSEKIVSLHQSSETILNNKNKVVKRLNPDQKVPAGDTKVLAYLEDCHGNTYVRWKNITQYGGHAVYNAFDFNCTCSNEGCFAMSFTPVSAGIHTLSLRWQEKHVEGSPFKVKVYKLSDVNRRGISETTGKRLLFDSLSMSFDGNNLQEQNCTPDKRKIRNDNISNSETISASQQRIRKQYTITKRRILKKVIARNGEEIIITESQTPPLSRQSSLTDISDYTDEDGTSSPYPRTTHSSRSSSPALLRAAKDISSLRRQRSRSSSPNMEKRKMNLEPTMARITEKTALNDVPRTESSQTLTSMTTTDHESNSTGSNKRPFAGFGNKISQKFLDSCLQSLSKREYGITRQNSDSAIPKLGNTENKLPGVNKRLSNVVVLNRSLSETSLEDKVLKKLFVCAHGNIMSRDQESHEPDNGSPKASPNLKMLQSSSLRKACFYISGKAITTSQSLVSCSSISDSMSGSRQELMSEVNLPHNFMRNVGSKCLLMKDEDYTLRHTDTCENDNSHSHTDIKDSMNLTLSNEGGAPNNERDYQKNCSNLQIFPKDFTEKKNKEMKPLKKLNIKETSEKFDVESWLQNSPLNEHDKFEMYDDEQSAIKPDASSCMVSISRPIYSFPVSQTNDRDKQSTDEYSVQAALMRIESSDEFTTPRSTAGKFSARRTRSNDTDKKENAYFRRTFSSDSKRGNLQKQSSVFPDADNDPSLDDVSSLISNDCHSISLSTSTNIHKDEIEGTHIRNTDSTTYDLCNTDNSSEKENFEMRNDHSSVFRTISDETKLIKPFETRVAIVVPRVKCDKGTVVYANDIVKETKWDVAFDYYNIFRRRMCMRMAETNEPINNDEEFIPCNNLSNRGRSFSVFDSRSRDKNVHAWIEKHPQLRINAPFRQSTIETTDSGVDDDNGILSGRRASLYSNFRFTGDNQHQILCRRPYKGKIPLDPKLIQSSSNTNVYDRETDTYGNDHDEDQRNSAEEMCKHQPHANEDHMILNRQCSNEKSKRYDVERNVIIDAVKLKLKTNENGSHSNFVDTNDSVSYDDKTIHNMTFSRSDEVNSEETIQRAHAEYLANINSNLTLSKIAIQTKSTSSSISVDDPYYGFGVTRDNRTDLLSHLNDFKNLNLKNPQKQREELDIDALQKMKISDEVFTNESCRSFSPKSEHSSRSQCISSSEDLSEVSNYSSSMAISKRFTSTLERPFYLQINDVIVMERNSIAPFAHDEIFCSDGENEAFSSSVSTEDDDFVCKADGIGLVEGHVGMKNNFQVWTNALDNGSLSVNIYGPKSHSVVETCVVYTGDNLYEVIYEVRHPGIYIICVKWSDENVQNSPFTCRITY